ncbi:MAG: type II toxin-antitoxin system HicB family antitoxin [Candidatus Diapherotrites archaeon]
MALEKRIFTVLIERDEEGWLVADVPELQGCHTQAKTMDKLLKRAKEVIELCLEEQKEAPKTEFVGIQMLEVPPCRSR